jgi:hypothetical protein
VVVLTACATAVAPPGTGEKQFTQADPVVFSFATVGDSRQDPDDPDPTTAPLSRQDQLWLQNTRAFSRILKSVRAQGADMLFFNGDMIMGYGRANVPARTATVSDIVSSDLVRFYTQYAFWRGMVAPVMQAGTYVVPVPGNHETQCKACGRKAQVENEDAWRANMGDLILDDARFVNLFGVAPRAEVIGNTAGPDNLPTDQTKLTYSFDFGDSHFAVINTDPVGNDAHAPTKWLDADLKAARTRGAKHAFVFGHKPAFTYHYGADPRKPLPSSPSGLDGDVAARDAFWSVIENNDATYFCGHEHIFNMSRPLAEKGGKAWQVLVGSGGSPFEAAPTAVTVNPSTDRDYAWAFVRVYASGNVHLTAYGFTDAMGPTRVLDSMWLVR